MSKVESKLNLTQVGRVAVSVSDTDRAIEFYVDTIALAPPPQGTEAGGKDTGICLDTSDVDADHAALKAAGVDVDNEVSRWGGPVPPMFWLRDPDGNSLIVVQPSA
jgi:catechol 2,3-dioxygenase-like lactoylglutathione lyase family enzyme